MNLKHALTTLSKLTSGQKLRVVHDELELEDRYYLQGLQRWLHGDGEAVTCLYIHDLTKVMRAWVRGLLNGDEINITQLEVEHALLQAAMVGLQHLKVLYPKQNWPTWSHDEKLLRQAIYLPKSTSTHCSNMRFPVLH